MCLLTPCRPTLDFTHQSSRAIGIEVIGIRDDANVPIACFFVSQFSQGVVNPAKGFATTCHFALAKDNLHGCGHVRRKMKQIVPFGWAVFIDVTGGRNQERQGDGDVQQGFPLASGDQLFSARHHLQKVSSARPLAECAVGKKWGADGDHLGDCILRIERLRVDRLERTQAVSDQSNSAMSVGEEAIDCSLDVMSTFVNNFKCCPTTATARRRTQRAS